MAVSWNVGGTAARTAPAGGSPVNVTLGGWLGTIVIDTGADAVTVPLLSTARAVSENVPLYGLFHVYE